jgi:hypothetical protein
MMRKTEMHRIGNPAQIWRLTGVLLLVCGFELQGSLCGCKLGPIWPRR